MRWLVWDPEGKASVVESDSELGAISEACDALSVW